ncbi:MAG: Na+:solute symporter [Flammeovirgaceae bacterium]
MFSLSTLDLIIIVIFLITLFIISLRYVQKAKQSTQEFFLGGRNLPWWLAGTSMVATTFAADTPLLITELVGNHGISGNWLWWNALIGGIITTFFFAKLWRRANVLTDVAFTEIRYGGKPAAFLRGFKSLYLGLFMNSVIIAWVNLALMKLMFVFFGITYAQQLICVALAMLFVAIFSSISGLLGVVVTDFIQFIFAMTGCIVLAFVVINSEKIGGITALVNKLPETTLSFFPRLNTGNEASETIKGFSIGIATFFAFVGVQWWASWYPGAEPGGGGYVAQRMMSAKNESHAIKATLFFQLAHYGLRPWAWIVVALCAIVLYPDLSETEKGLGYVMVMKDFLPEGLRGFLLAAFLAAYMSTISTQLNWGASYLVHDFYQRFIKKQSSEKELVNISRISTFLIMLIALGVTTMMDTLENAFKFMIECGAGLGAVLMLRWYWWRINVWSEITATFAPFVGFALSKFVLNLQFPNSLFFTAGITTITWIIATYLTKPESDDTLINFYKKVQPQGLWQPIAKKAKIEVSEENFKTLIMKCLLGIIMVYSFLFATGYLILGNYPYGFICMGIFVFSIGYLWRKLE